MKKAGLGGLLGRLLGVSRPEQEAIYYLDVERSW